TSTCVLRWVVPREITRSRSAVARCSMGAASAISSFCIATLSATLNPLLHGWCGRQRSPKNVVSRCMWPSTKPGVTRAPWRSTRSFAAAACNPGGSSPAILPPATRIVAGVPSGSLAPSNATSISLKMSSGVPLRWTDAGSVGAECTVARHQPAVSVYRPADGSRHDRLLDMGGIHHHQVGRRTGLEAVIGDAEGTRPVRRDDVEGQRQLVVGEETGTVAEQHGALQHVGFAVGPPGIANIVVAAEHQDAGITQHPDRGKRPVARRIGHDGDAGSGQRFGCPAHDVERNVAQAVGVADRDPALQAEGSGAGGNLLELEYAEQPRIVEV